MAATGPRSVDDVPDADDTPDAEPRTSRVPSSAVKRALAALTRADPDGTVRHDYEHRTGPDREHLARLVDDAETAMDDVEAAADFVTGGGLTRLRQAVAIAERRGHTRIARDGTDVLTAVARYRRATGSGPSAFHFHSGRGTVLRTNGKGMNR